jgi:hypothetical protein
VLLAAPTVRARAQSPPPALAPAGDLRTGYFNSQRQERSGEVTGSDDFRVRLRYGAGLRLGELLSARARVAGRFSTSQDGFSLLLHDHAASPEGLRLGEVTFDEAFLHFAPASRATLRLGRMQTKFVLADLMGKSLDRGDSPNTDITWTDGAHLAVGLGGGWNSHLIAQHNSPRGPTNTLRRPLGFAAERSRIGLFGVLENTTRWGPVRQRSLDLTYLPASFAGPAGGSERRDYVAMVARGWAAWPLGAAGGTIGVGGEVGHAPVTPSREELGLGAAGSGDGGGTALQLAATVNNLVPRHQLGFVYGYAEAGWLVAPDFRNNDHLMEARYRWDFAANRSFDARLRRRWDVESPLNVHRPRRDTDFYIRYNMRF